MSVTNPERVVTKQDLADFYDELLPFISPKSYAGFTPIGTIIHLIAESAPANYLICDGATYNKSDYPELCAHLWSLTTNSQYKVSGDDTKFKVPDLQGQFLRGTGTNSDTTQGNGSSVGVRQKATQMPLIAEWGNTKVGFTGVSGGDSSVSYADSQVNSSTGTNVWKQVTVASTGNTGGKDQMTVRPTNTSVLFCIATKNIYLDPKNDYSTEEKVIGTWINNEPLYQKTIQTTLPTITTDGTVGVKLVDITDWNIDKVINVDGIVNTSNNFNLIDSCWNVSGAGSPQYFIRTNIDLSGTTKYFNIRCNRISLSESPAYVTIQYTKTT